MISDDANIDDGPPPTYADDVINQRALAIRPGEGTIRKSISDFTDAEWDAARVKEYDGMTRNEVWEPSNLPRGTRTLDTKEVLKARSDNSLKVRLTARGFMQQQNVNFIETYSAVATPASIRIVVAIAASFGLPLNTADVEQAYLQADIKEEIYLEVPSVLRNKPEFKDVECLKLKKGLYGTKQAGRGWYEKLKKAILQSNFKESPEDPCLYFKTDNNGYLVAVDQTRCVL